MWKVFLFAIFLSAGSFVMASDIALDFHNKSITDDEIANAIRYPRPASVSTLLNRIDYMRTHGEIDPNEVRSLDVSSNNITLKGASQIFDYIITNLVELEHLDLSNNQIRDWRGQREYQEFENSFLNLLQMPSLHTVNLKTNYLGLNWYQYILSTFPHDLVEKIKI